MVLIFNFDSSERGGPVSCGRFRQFFMLCFRHGATTLNQDLSTAKYGPEDSN